MPTPPYPNLESPASMLAHIGEVFAGEYDLPYTRSAPVIVDIGANIGAFAIWARRRWPGATIHCYEPVPSNFQMLVRNLERFAPNITANNFAIGDVQRTRMFLGKNNCGEASFFDVGEQTTDTVAVVTKGPEILPRAHILKIDTEGSEIEILERHDAIDYDVVLTEFHGENHRRRLDQLLPEYCLVGGKIRHLHRGVLKYVHRRAVPQQYAGYEAL